MGFRVSWIAVQGKTPEAILATLALRETGAREDLPESEIAGLLLPSGWYVVFFNDVVPPECDDVVLAGLSAGTVLMAVIVEETSMVSEARGYANGQRTWQILHDAQAGLADLTVAGVPPPPFEEVRAACLARTARGHGDVDYMFDLPAELCSAMTGFRHDEDMAGMDGEGYTVLERVVAGHAAA